MKASDLTMFIALATLFSSTPSVARASQFLDCDNFQVKTQNFSSGCYRYKHDRADYENCLANRCAVHNEAIKRQNPNGIACPGPDDRGRMKKWLDKGKLGCPRDHY